MQGFKDLAESERGVFSIALVLAVTALAVLKIITGAEWLTFVKWVGMTLVASKTVTTAIDSLRSAPKENDNAAQ